MVQFFEMPREPSLGELLGGGMSKGLIAGTQKTLANQLKLQEEQRKDLKKSTAPFSIEEFMKGLTSYPISKEDLGQDPQAIQGLLDKTNALTKKIGRSAALGEIASNLDKYMSPEVDTAGEQMMQEEKPAEQGPLAKRLKPREQKRSLWGDLGPGGAFHRGILSGVSGKASTLAFHPEQSYKEYEKSSRLKEKAGIWDNILYAVGNFLSDSPGYLFGAAGGVAAGAAAGGPPGAVAGGGAGAFALPKLLNSTLEEFMKFKDKGGKGSFEDFLNSFNKVSSETAYAGALGSVFGALGKVLPLMKAANPAIKSFFETTKYPKLVEMLGTSTVQAMGLTAAEAAAKRDLPSKEEVAGTFTQVVGLNLLHMGTNRAKGIVDKVREFDNPKGIADTAEMIKEAADKAGIDQEKIKAGDPKEERKLYKVVTDITKTYKPRAERPIAGKEISKEALEARGKETKEKAEAIAKAPAEDLLEKPVKETPAMKAEKLRASKEMVAADRDIEKVQRNIEKLTKAQEQGIRTKESQATVAKARANYEKQLEDLKAKKKELEYIAKRGIKPFSAIEAKATAERHVAELEEAARNPEGKTAQEWERMFDRDQKYIDKAIDILKSGQEPVEPYKDRYIKTLDAYNEVYRKAIDNIDKAIATAKVKERAGLEKIRNKLKRNLSINESKLLNHRNKLSSKEALRKGSSLMRHYLQQLRQDLPGMQKPVIEYKQAMEGTEKKTEQVFHEKLTANKAAEVLDNNMKAEFKGEKLSETEQNKEKVALDEIAKDAKIDPSQFKNWWNMVKKAYRMTKGEPLKFFNELRKTYQYLPWKTRIVAGSLINAILQHLKVPGLIRLGMLPSGNLVERSAIVYGGSLMRDKIIDWQNMHYANKIQKSRLPSERKKIRLELEGKYAKSRVSEIFKLSKESV